MKRDNETRRGKAKAEKSADALRRENRERPMAEAEAARPRKITMTFRTGADAGETVKSGDASDADPKS